MIYHQIDLKIEIIHVKRLSPSVPLFKIIHREGTMEIFKNISSGCWCTLCSSGSSDKYSAELIGAEIELYDGQLNTSAARLI